MPPHHSTTAGHQITQAVCTMVAHAAPHLAIVQCSLGSKPDEMNESDSKNVSSKVCAMPFIPWHSAALNAPAYPFFPRPTPQPTTAALRTMRMHMLNRTSTMRAQKKATGYAPIASCKTAAPDACNGPNFISTTPQGGRALQAVHETALAVALLPLQNPTAAAPRISVCRLRR